MLLLKNLTKLFNKEKVVNIEELHIPKGKLYGFIGANGAGKTTTIKMITTLLKPNSGKIFINGINLEENPEEAKKHIGYIADKPMLYEKLSAREFIRFKANLYGTNNSKELEKEIEKYLDLFEMKEKSDKLIQSYSHGMKQKTAIISTLIHNPKLLILDEPTVGLDPKGANTLKLLLKDYTKKGNTVLLTTHILEIAEKICDMLAIIKKGEIIFEGTLSSLKKIKGDKQLEDIFLALMESDIS